MNEGEPARGERAGPGVTINLEVRSMAVKKRQGVRNAAAAPVQRLNVRVTAEAYERLLVHAIKARVSPGELAHVWGGQTARAT
jgi:hypothetical protein